MLFIVESLNRKYLTPVGHTQYVLLINRIMSKMLKILKIFNNYKCDLQLKFHFNKKTYIRNSPNTGNINFRFPQSPFHNHRHEYII